MVLNAIVFLIKMHVECKYKHNKLIYVNVQECYMDKVVTPTFDILFRGGCRARDVGSTKMCLFVCLFVVSW